MVHDKQHSPPQISAPVTQIETPDEELECLDLGPGAIPIPKSELPPINPNTTSIKSISQDRSHSASSPRTAPLWQQVVRAGRASRKIDVWANLTADVPTERALEHSYDVESNTWSAKPILVKLDSGKPVAHGAMRACFRMKMLHSTGTTASAASPTAEPVSPSSFSARALRRLDDAHEWHELRQQPLADVISGIGPATAAHIAGELGLCGRQTLKLGPVLDLMCTPPPAIATPNSATHAASESSMSTPSTASTSTNDTDAGSKARTVDQTKINTDKDENECKIAHENMVWKVKDVIHRHSHDDLRMDEIDSTLRLLVRKEKLHREMWATKTVNFMAKRYLVCPTSDGVDDESDDVDKAKSSTEDEEDDASGVGNLVSGKEEEDDGDNDMLARVRHTASMASSDDIMPTEINEHRHQDRGDQSYRDDVVMQEVCKFLAGKYNAQTPAPPKLIDFVSVGVVELVEREGRPFFAFECLMSGDYHKWNTNAGWVDNERIRHTPNAFSFFTFRYTKGEMMVVDMQGINELFTDPQIHTANGTEFGDGNLGARGMALFLNRFSYRTNPVVQYLGLPPVHLAPNEQPIPQPNQTQEYEDGLAYLEGEEWQARMTAAAGGAQEGEERAVAIGSIGWTTNTASRSAVKSDSNAKCAQNEGEVREDLIGVPMQATVEAQVHVELAYLHEQEDSRVTQGRGCTTKQAIHFHRRLAASMGHRDSMEYCAREGLSAYQEQEHQQQQKQQEQDGDVNNTSTTTALFWWRLAAERGSREAMLACVDALLVKQNDTGKDDSGSDTCAGNSKEAVQWLELALTADDGMTDSERKANMVPCTYEVMDRLGQLLQVQSKGNNNATRTATGDMMRARAKEYFTNGAESAMGLRCFKVAQRMQEQAALLDGVII